MLVFNFSKNKKTPLSRVVQEITEISTLPQILSSIQEIASDSESSATELDEALETDPALTSRILQMANSTYYGSSQKVGSVKRAIVILGFDEVKKIAIAASVCDRFQSSEIVNGFTREGLWQHSVAVSLCAKIIAQRLGVANEEHVFTAGIMHDIGIIIEDQHLHNEFLRVLRDPSLDEMGLVEAENTVFGFDHAELGGQVAKNWKIPEDICNMITFHHRPLSMDDKSSRDPSIIYLADIICNAKKIGFIPNKKAESEDIFSVLETLGLQKRDIVSISEKLTKEIRKAGDLFNLKKTTP
jgi:putative nucleotidyltransferase with HDIG domain